MVDTTNTHTGDPNDTSNLPDSGGVKDTSPVVVLIDKTTGVEIDNTNNKIDFGVVKAGAKSDTKTLQLWNNKSGKIEMSPMRDVEMFMLDNAGTRVEPSVVDGWLHAKCISGGDTTFTPLELNSMTLSTSVTDAIVGEIKGVINDGVDTNSPSNLSEFELYHQVVKNILTVNPGTHNLSLVIRYYFI